jgi:hypothetical protein
VYGLPRLAAPIAAFELAQDLSRRFEFFQRHLKIRGKLVYMACSIGKQPRQQRFVIFRFLSPLRRGDVVTIDNLGAHKVAGVREASRPPVQA